MKRISKIVNLLEQESVIVQQSNRSRKCFLCLKKINKNDLSVKIKLDVGYDLKSHLVCLCKLGRKIDNIRDKYRDKLILDEL